MNIFKDVITLNIFVFSLLVLYQTTNHLLALISVITIALFYVFKHFKLNNFLKKELKNQAEIFETLFNSSSDIIVYLDLNQNIIACNDALVKNFGIPKKELLGKSLKRIKEVHRQSGCIDALVKNLQSKLEESLATKRPVQFNDQYLLKKKTNSYSVLISPTYSSNSKINGTVIVARNVTAEHLAVKHALEKEAQLKCILENMPVCSYMKDTSDCFIIGSASFKDVLGCSDEELCRLKISDMYDEEYWDIVRAEDDEVCRTKSSIEIERMVVFPTCRFLGRIRKSPILDEKGEVKYLVVMYENIEAEKEIERQKEYFIETLIHDLKIPTLAQLRGMEVLQSNALGPLMEEQHDLISQICDSCKYILEMISMVLSTYRFENGQKKLYYEKFNMSELITECFEGSVSLAKEKNITFAYAATFGDMTVEADRNEIKTVIMNLLSNAVIYSNKNEQVVVRVETSNNKMSFIITSTGITLSDRECMTMFKKYDTDSPNYTTIGHGISLYLCKKIIDMHNGKIFSSTDKQRTNTFTFVIPQFRQKALSATEMPTLV